VTFRPREHIRRRTDFEATYESGVKVNGRLMTMFVRATDVQHARLGIAATRKIGGAVIRNRAKRLTRELFRNYKPTAPLDIVVIPRREFLDASYSSLEREFRALLERAARSPQPRGGRGPGGARRGRPRSARPDPRV
jgi:ribonuclease P protein component